MGFVLTKEIGGELSYGVYVNIVSRLVQDDTVTTVEGSGQQVMHEENGGYVGEGSSDKKGARLDPSEVDAECMDDEASGSGDEEAADNDDPVPVIQYFCVVLGCCIIPLLSITPYPTRGYQNSNI